VSEVLPIGAAARELGKSSVWLSQFFYRLGDKADVLAPKCGHFRVVPRANLEAIRALMALPIAEARKAG
jgi:hypothetical protein